MDLAVRLTSATSPAATWLRRALTIPALLLFWLVDVAVLPVVLVAALVGDLANGRPLASVRFHLAVAFTLSIHVLGLLLLSIAWLAQVVGREASERDLDVRVAAWWATTTWRAVTRLYRMHVIIEGGEVLDRAGPVIILSRHASLLDMLLPMVSVSAPRARVPRYVAKREVLWDPCVDIACHRIATAFVRRGGLEHDVDVAAVASLVDDLGPHDTVVIFPEGTRFSEAKRAHVLAALARKDGATFARATRLKNVLPPHLGGPLAALERARHADVVFCAHTGLEGASHLRDLLAGSLIGRTVHLRYWRVASHDVPTDPEMRIEWLWQWWERIDRWIEAHRAGVSSTDR